MANTIHKKVEVVGTSDESFSKAADNAIAKAAESVRNLEWFEIVQMTGNIVDNKVGQYQVTMKIGFKLD